MSSLFMMFVLGFAVGMATFAAIIAFFVNENAAQGLTMAAVAIVISTVAHVKRYAISKLDDD